MKYIVDFQVRPEHDTTEVVVAISDTVAKPKQARVLETSLLNDAEATSMTLGQVRSWQRLLPLLDSMCRRWMIGFVSKQACSHQIDSKLEEQGIPLRYYFQQSNGQNRYSVWLRPQENKNAKDFAGRLPRKRRWIFSLVAQMLQKVFSGVWLVKLKNRN